MKKGLNVTLMTVAIAVMAFQAMAMAPTITDIRDPIIGGNLGATPARPFVYPDAFNIVDHATDDSTSPVNIRWSYYYTGTEVYRINNVDRVTVGDATIKNPAANQRINGATKDPLDADNLTSTITIRNVKYSPISGSGSTPGFTGIGDLVTVTLYASDGTTYSMTDATFYTDNGGNNRLSGINPTPIMHQTAWPTQGSYTWAFYGTNPLSATSSTNGGTAMCIFSPLTGVNVGAWGSNWELIPISQNTVYRIRAKITGNQSGIEKMPFFDLVLDNMNWGVGKGFDLFGADMMFLDTEGGASAAINTPSGTTYEMWWCPSAAKNTAFNANSLWDSAHADGRFEELAFRVLDTNENQALSADLDSGSLCLSDLQIDAYPLASLTFTKVWDADLSSGHFNGGGFNTTGTSETGGTFLLTQGAGAASSELAGASPGDGVYSLANLDQYLDDWPVAWESGVLYSSSWFISAVDGDDHGFDAMWVGFDTPAYELILQSYVVTHAERCAMPKAAPAQEWIGFMYGHTASKSSHTQFKQLRPRLTLGNSAAITEMTNAGSWRIHSVTVSKVGFQ